MCCLEYLPKTYLHQKIASLMLAITLFRLNLTDILVYIVAHVEHYILI